jgi:hypothetical protein
LFGIASLFGSTYLYTMYALTSYLIFSQNDLLTFLFAF